MEVILCQDVTALGKTGDIVKVKDGHARNYLIPRQLALAATDRKSVV
jgi:large subunit ribosomal protein L9